MPGNLFKPFFRLIGHHPQPFVPLRVISVSNGPSGASLPRRGFPAQGVPSTSGIQNNSNQFSS
jgi:hypothetical protein